MNFLECRKFSLYYTVDFVDVNCPLKCGKCIERRKLEEHECAKRSFTCEHCDYQSTYEGVIDDHAPKCPRYPEKCPNKCSEEDIERRFLQRHLVSYMRLNASSPMLGARLKYSVD